MRILGTMWRSLFGCWHRHTSRVFNDERRLYVRCLYCGARIPYSRIQFSVSKKTRRRRRMTIAAAAMPETKKRKTLFIYTTSRPDANEPANPGKAVTDLAAEEKCLMASANFLSRVKKRGPCDSEGSSRFRVHGACRMSEAHQTLMTIPVECYARARRLLHNRSTTGITVCCSCGSPAGDTRVNRACGSSFTAYNALMRLSGDHVCDGCDALLKEPAMRFTSVFHAGGVRSKMLREDFWRVLDNPPDEFVLTWAVSHKKHTWLHAGLSDPDDIYVGTDNRTIRYTPRLHSDTRIAVASLVAEHIHSQQIITGRYHPSVRQRLGDRLNECEISISPWRASGLIEFLAFIAPRPQSKTITTVQGGVMAVDPGDELAAQFVSRLAKRSKFRSDRPQDFWSGYLEARVERVRTLPLSDQANKLMQFIGVSASSAAEVTEFVGGLNSDQTQQVETAMRQRPRLVCALAYTMLKQERKAKDELD